MESRIGNAVVAPPGIHFPPVRVVLIAVKYGNTHNAYNMQAVAQHIAHTSTGTRGWIILLQRYARKLKNNRFCRLINKRCGVSCFHARYHVVFSMHENRRTRDQEISHRLCSSKRHCSYTFYPAGIQLTGNLSLR